VERGFLVFWRGFALLSISVFQLFSVLIGCPPFFTRMATELMKMLWPGLADMMRARSYSIESI
jgi:hypothetical protein